MTSRQRRLESATKTSLHDIIELDDELYVVTNLDPLELTAIEHYDTRGDN